jgi:hypothetical protein
MISFLFLVSSNYLKFIKKNLHYLICFKGIFLADPAAISSNFLTLIYKELILKRLI